MKHLSKYLSSMLKKLEIAGIYISLNAQKFIPFHYSNYSTYISINSVICHHNIYYTYKCTYNMKGVHTHVIMNLHRISIIMKIKQRFSVLYLVLCVDVVGVTSFKIGFTAYCTKKVRWKHLLLCSWNIVCTKNFQIKH